MKGHLLDQLFSPTSGKKAFRGTIVLRLVLIVLPSATFNGCRGPDMPVQPARSQGSPITNLPGHCQAPRLRKTPLPPKKGGKKKHRGLWGCICTIKPITRIDKEAKSLLGALGLLALFIRANFP